MQSTITEVELDNHAYYIFFLVSIFKANWKNPEVNYKFKMEYLYFNQIEYTIISFHPLSSQLYDCKSISIINAVSCSMNVELKKADYISMRPICLFIY